MELSKFIKGLQILSAYYNDPDGYHIEGAHDYVFLYPTDKPVSDEDLKTLVELGWFQEGVPVSGDAFQPKDYIPSEGWAVYA